MRCNSCKNCNWHVDHERQWEWVQCDKNHWSDDPNTNGESHRRWDGCKDYEPEFVDMTIKGATK